MGRPAPRGPAPHDSAARFLGGKRAAAATVALAASLWTSHALGADALAEASAAYDRGDHAGAARLFRPLAERGHPQARFKLGEMHLIGFGVPQDPAETARLWRMCADQGDPDCQANLGTLHSIGTGVPQDYVLAHMWWNLAASRFAASAEDRRSAAASMRSSIEAKMTPDQVAEAQRRAREWKPASR